MVVIQSLCLEKNFSFLLHANIDKKCLNQSELHLIKFGDSIIAKNFIETIYCSKTLQNKLQKLQNKAGQIITGDCYKTASDTVRSKLSWDTLEARREKQLETCMIQIMKDNSIVYLRELFTIHANSSNVRVKK